MQHVSGSLSKPEEGLVLFNQFSFVGTDWSPTQQSDRDTAEQSTQSFFSVALRFHVQLISIGSKLENPDAD